MPKIKLKVASSENEDKIFKAFSDKMDKYEMQGVSREVNEEVEKHLEMGEMYQDQRKVNDAIAEFKKAIELNPYDDKAYSMLGSTYLHCCGRLLGPEKAHLLAIKELKKATEINPLNVAAHAELFSVYYRTGRNRLALEELSIIHRLNPDDEYVSQLLTYGLPDYKDTEIFKKMLKYDLQNIISIVSSKKIKLILQNYPSGVWSSDTLTEIAESNKLLFVDNQSEFAKLKTLNEYEKQEYFAEDGHCNAEGYQVIAKNVYRVLRFEAEELLK